MLKSALTLSAAILAAACSSMNGEAPMASDLQAAGDSLQDAGSAAAGLAAANLATDAPAYVANAAVSDRYEIMSSELALQKSQSSEVKAFAQQMIAAHSASSNELKPLAEAAGLALPARLDARRHSMLGNLQAASADDFDDRYIDQQTAAHQEALTLHRAFAERGDHSQLKAFAARTAPAVEQHLLHVKKLDRSDADD